MEPFLVRVNINRFKEGARVLEDIARFLLKDSDLFEKIKDLKHRAPISSSAISVQEDIGGADFIENIPPRSLLQLAIANGCRMQEAVRVLEEIADRQKYKQIRFLSYAIHAELIAKLKKTLKQDYLTGIYAICDPEKYPIEQMAKKINQAGISICQIRMKSAGKRQCLAAVKAMRELLTEKTLLIVNDHLDIALSYADGVHLGQEDLPISEARRLVPEDFIIGATCHCVAQAQAAIAEGASYLAVGCLYPTATKAQAIPVSLQVLTQIVKLSTIPVCAIGGINRSNIADIVQTKVDMVAMQTALWG